MRDPLIMQAAIAHSAVHWDIMQRGAPGYLAATQTRHAVSMLAERIADNRKAVNDELLEAVSLVAANSVCQLSHHWLQIANRILQECHWRCCGVENAHVCIGTYG